MNFDWAGLVAMLTDGPTFRAWWRRDPFEVERCVAAFEENAGFRPQDAYAPAVVAAAFGIGSRGDERGPASGLDLEFGHALARLFNLRGDFGVSGILAQHLLTACMAAGDERALYDALGVAADAHPDLWQAWELREEQFRLCIDSDDESVLRLAARPLGHLALLRWLRYADGHAAHSPRLR